MLHLLEKSILFDAETGTTFSDMHRLTKTLLDHLLGGTIVCTIIPEIHLHRGNWEVVKTRASVQADT